MGERYLPSDSIYDSIIRYEKTDPNGLNGFILLIHIGTDPRRKDKFYNRLDYLIRDLKERGYSFVKITQLLKDS
jgi:peptidoglycan/xylan/chitin deacetylase (PgdA/CDA1 family)